MMYFKSVKHNNIRSIIMTILLGLTMPSLAYSFEVKIIDKGPAAKQKIHLSKVEKTYPLATVEDIFCGKNNHITRFRLNDKHAGLPFSITAKKMTRVKIRWDHPDKVLFPSPEEKKTVIFPHAGGEARFYFRSHQPVSGNVYIMNDQDQVIKSCPYSFLPAKKFRQSISVNINETEYDRTSELNNETSNNISVNYRISTRSTIPDGSYWSLSVGVSQSESSTESRRVNSSFSYNW